MGYKKNNKDRRFSDLEVDGVLAKRKSVKLKEESLEVDKWQKLS